MFPKYKRLKTKDVLFLTKKRMYFSYGFFWFFYVNQYSNRENSQISFHVSIKYNKHASQRNILKRAVLRQASLLIDQWVFNNHHWKIFITLNKNKIPLLQKEFDNIEKKNIIHSIRKHFTQSFIALSKYLWNSSKT